MLKLFAIIMLTISTGLAQGLMKIETDKTNYSYGDSIEVRVTILNNTDTSFSMWGSSTCLVMMGFNSVQFQIACTADNTEFVFPPGSSRTWIWELNPSVLGIPDKDGAQIIRAYGGWFKDSIAITAPKYYGGTLEVGIKAGIPAQEIQNLRDSLNATVLYSDTSTFNGIILERWQIKNYSVDSLDTAYAHDYRLAYIEVSRPLICKNVVYTSIEPTINLPREYHLYQNYPNPFNPATVVKYKLSNAAYIILKLYNELGKEIKILDKGFRQAGSYYIKFNGYQYASGVYFYQLLVNGINDNKVDYLETKKMILLK
ncbi:MAG: hypothetical protein M1480_16235 [Bacteroidetes bacterium]|nr:hypothetical protein [Bacteroidota bacterium]